MGDKNRFISNTNPFFHAYISNSYVNFCQFLTIKRFWIVRCVQIVGRFNYTLLHQRTKGSRKKRKKIAQKVSYNGTYIRWLLRNRCARKEQFILSDMFNAFDHIASRFCFVVTPDFGTGLWFFMIFFLKKI